MGNFQFISNKNYMKKDPSSGVSTMLGPNVSQFFGSYFNRVTTIPHNLGYVPLFRVYYEPYRDDKVMEAFQDTNYALPETPNIVRVNAIAPTCMAWADETNLYIELDFWDNTLAALDYPIYWTIYKDYGMLL